MALTFEWDSSKARSNADKHGLTFEEASTAFADVMSLTIPDPTHSDDESRFVLLGVTHRERLVVVAHTHRSDRIRIISARRANAIEREVWEHGQP